MKLLLIFALFISMSTAQAKPAPGVSGVLSIIPGLGQVANGNPFEGVAWFVTTVGLMATRDNTAREFGFNLWFYNMYDAFRDAGAKRTQKYSVFENYLGNFNPLYVIDPIGGPIVAVAALSPGTTKSDKGTPGNAVQRAFYYTSVGLGEEGLFRGFLFPGLSTAFNSTWAGAIVSSALFSAAHGEGGAAFVSRFVGGMLFCWQTHRNNYDIRPSIFAHTWFDFLLTRRGNKSGNIEAKASQKLEAKAMFKYELRF